MKIYFVTITWLINAWGLLLVTGNMISLQWTWFSVSFLMQILWATSNATHFKVLLFSYRRHWKVWPDLLPANTYLFKPHFVDFFGMYWMTKSLSLNQIMPSSEKNSFLEVYISSNCSSNSSSFKMKYSWLCFSMVRRLALASTNQDNSSVHFRTVLPLSLCWCLYKLKSENVS